MDYAQIYDEDKTWIHSQLLLMRALQSMIVTLIILLQVFIVSEALYRAVKVII